jgi:subfamily B ATP-binding cassette protein MsbA
MTSLRLYRRLLHYARPYWWVVGLAVLGMMIVAAGDLVLAYLVIPIVRSFDKPNPSAMQMLPLTVIGVFALRGLGAFMSEYGMGWTGYRVVYDLRCELVDKLLKLPTSYYDAQAVGVVQSKITFDAHQLAFAATGTIASATRSSLAIAAMFGYLLWLNWQLTLLTLVVIPVVAWVTRYLSRRLRRVAHDIQSRTATLTQVLEEILGAYRIVGVFGGENYERQRARAAANRLRVSMSKESSATARSSPLTQLVAALAVGFILWIALARAQAGAFDSAVFLSYLAALITLLDRLKGLSGINAAIQRGLAAAESIFSFLGLEEDRDSGTVALVSARGEIALQNISLRYKGREHDALTDVSLAVAPGETLALVGSSGSGKTSLVNLIPRFYEPTAGHLYVDGHDVTTLTRASLRAQIAVVTQDVLLFNDTIAANIAYGAMANASREAIERASEAAGAPVHPSPPRASTPLSASGACGSREASARVVIPRSSERTILILDERLAHDSESRARRASCALYADASRTTIVIAHRLSTIEYADRIIVLEHGRIVEQER